MRGKHSRATVSAHHARFPTSNSITHTHTSMSASISIPTPSDEWARSAASATGPSARRTSTNCARVKSCSNVGVIVSVLPPGAGAQEARREAKVSARPGESLSGWAMDTQRSRSAVQCERSRSKSLFSDSSSSSVAGERDGQST